MAHEMMELDHAVYGSSVSAWHGLGTVVDGQPTSADALRLAKLADWGLQLQPVYTQSDPLDRMQPVPDTHAVCRTDLDSSDARRVLGIVGSKYRPIENEKAFAICDAIAGEGGARFETAGSLHNGRRVYMLLRMPDTIAVRDDVIQPYLLASTTHDGSGALEFRFTSVRVVCNNTLTWAIRGQSAECRIRHTENHDSQIREAKRILTQGRDHFNAAGEVYNRWAAQDIDSRFVQAYLDALLPDPRGDKNNTNAQNRRAEIAGLFNGRQIGAYQEATNGTAYGLYNALTQWVDHSRTIRRSKGRSEAEARFDSSMFGSGHDLRNRGARLMEHAIEHVGVADSAADVVLSQIDLN